jgi:transcriptional regulator with XRE-family HTH domain
MTKPTEDPRQVIAARLREARKLAGISQGKVAEMLTMHRPTISEIEKGNRKVSAEELGKFAEIYDVSITWLIGDSPETLAANDPRIELAARELSKLKSRDFDRVLRLLAAMRQSEPTED